MFFLKKHILNIHFHNTINIAVRLLCVFVVGFLFSPISATAQFPWIEDFSDNDDEGVIGNCGGAPQSCNFYNPPSDWILSGSLNGLGNNDYFIVYEWPNNSGQYILEGKDMDNEMCYTSNTINVASATTVDIEVDLHEQGCGNGDYAEVSLIIDGTAAVYETQNGNFDDVTVTANDISINSSIAVRVCMRNNRDSEYLWISEIRITQDCAPPVAICQDITIDPNTTITANQIDNGSTADCGLASLSLDQYTFTCDDLGSNSITLTVTDNNGNTSTCSATVTLTENGTPGNYTPLITSCPSDINTNNDPGNNYAVVNYIVPTASNTINDFIYDFEFCQWTVLEEGDGYLISNAPNSITLYSANDGTAHAQTNFEITVPCDVTISFDWDFETDDVYDQAAWDPFGYILNGNFVQLSDGVVTDSTSSGTGAPEQNGSESIALSANDVFAFSQRTVDGIWERAHTTISNFSAAEAVTVTRAAGLASGSNFPIGTTTVTHEAKDCEDNTTTCSFDVTVDYVNSSCEKVIVNRHISFKINNE